MKSAQQIRWGMLVYTVAIALLAVAGAALRHEPRPHHPIAYDLLEGAGVILMFAGNLLYAFCYAPIWVRKFWKFAFPIVVVAFAASGVMSFYSERNVGVAAYVVGWILMFVFFFPSLRANFLLGYGGVDRIRTVEHPIVMSEEPLRDLAREMTKMRRTAQTGWIVAVSLLAVLVINSYFQYHFEPKSDSWLTVIRLVQRGKFTEALPIARHLVEKYPDSPDMRVLLGNIELSLGQLHQAEGSYTRAYELLPNEVTSTLLNAVRARIDQTEPTPTPTESP